MSFAGSSGWTPVWQERDRKEGWWGPASGENRGLWAEKQLRGQGPQVGDMLNVPEAVVSPTRGWGSHE